MSLLELALRLMSLAEIRLRLPDYKTLIVPMVNQQSTLHRYSHWIP